MHESPRIPPRTVIVLVFAILSALIAIPAIWSHQNAPAEPLGWTPDPGVDLYYDGFHRRFGHYSGRVIGFATLVSGFETPCSDNGGHACPFGYVLTIQDQTRNEVDVLVPEDVVTRCLDGYYPACAAPAEGGAR